MVKKSFVCSASFLLLLFASAVSAEQFEQIVTLNGQRVKLLIDVTVLPLAEEDTESLGGADSSVLTVAAWNVEARESDPDYICEQLANASGWDIVCLCEMTSSDIAAFTRSASQGEGSEFRSFVGDSSNSPFKLGMIYDTSEVALVDSFEIDIPGADGEGRAPLCGKFRCLRTEEEVLVVVNHLRRRDGRERRKEAEGLNSWVRTQELPVICTGDFNYDWSVGRRSGNRAFNLMVEGDVWRWVKPPAENIMPTQANPRYDSVLDFFFVSPQFLSEAWDHSAEIIVLPGQEMREDGGFFDDEDTSDHRPVVLKVNIDN